MSDFRKSFNHLTTKLRETKFIKENCNFFNKNIQLNTYKINVIERHITLIHEELINKIKNFPLDLDTIDLDKYDEIYSYIHDIKCECIELKKLLKINDNLINEKEKNKNKLLKNKHVIKNTKKYLKQNLIKGTYQMF